MPIDIGSQRLRCFVFTLKHLVISIKTPKVTITHQTFRHYRVRLYAFVGQSFSNELYLKGA